MARAQQPLNDPSCEYIKAEPLEFLSDGTLTSEAVLVEKLTPLTSCGLDQYDIEFFGQMSNMSIILKRLTATREISQLTYADLLEQIEAMMERETYQRIKKVTLSSEELGDRVGTETTWEQDRELFYELRASQRIIDAVGSYLKEHPNNQKTYREILELINAKR